jgi:hypothetical protein
MIKYFIIIINLLSWNCTTTVVTPSVSQVRYETTKDFVLPRVSEFKEVGRTTGTVCYESFLWMEDYIDKDSKNTFQYKALNDFNIEYLSKEDRTLFLAAYSEALAKSPKSDVVVNTRFTRKDENGKVCGTVSGEGLEISKIDNPNPMETSYKKSEKMAQSIEKNEKTGNKMKIISGVSYKEYDYVEFPLVLLNVAFTGGFASEYYSPNNKEGICNVPFYGGVVNIGSLGGACYLSYRSRNNRTTCEVPFIGGLANIFTLGGLCNRPSNLLSK